MKEKNIYFKGYYGFKNIGDDIFCITADWLCNNLWKNKIPIFIGESLPKLSLKSKKIEISNYFIRKIYEILLIIKSDYIIYFGGSLFSKKENKLDLKYIISRSTILSNKLITIGTSIGPFKNKDDYEYIRNILSKFKYILVRDYSSSDIVNKMGLKESFCFDLAILIDEIYPKLKIKNKNINKLKVGVSLCQFETYIGENKENETFREEAVLKFIKEIINSNIEIDEIIFFEFNGNEKVGDINIINKFNHIISKNINTRIVNYTDDTEKFIEDFSKCNFIIGMRLHSAILAYALNIPFMLVEYHQKCTEFLNTINNNYRFDINNNEKNIEFFKEIIENKCIPNIKEPDIFKKILKDRLMYIEKKL